MRRKRQKLGLNIGAEVKAPITPAVRSRQFRERLTRVGVVSSPVQGKITHAKQWSRWTP